MRDGQKMAMEQMGTAAWGSFACGAILAPATIAAIALPAAGLAPIWPSFLFLTFTYHISYLMVHEAVHGNMACGNKSLEGLQEIYGYVFGQLTLTSYTAHKKEHLAHHRNTNIAGKDPDLVVTPNPLSLIISAPRLYISNVVFFFRECWETSSTGEKIIFALENIIATSWRLAIGYFISWEVMLLVTMLPLITGGAWLIFVFAWLVHKPFSEVGRYVDTVTYTFPKALDGIFSFGWGFQNYHSVHHLYPRVPFYRYRPVFRSAEPEMIEKGAKIVRIWQ